MAQTVIGFFDSASEAQQAVQQLTSKGFSRDSIDVSSKGIDTTASSYTDTDNEESGISKFFKNLFSDDDDERDKYTRVASKSGSIVTVHAQTSEQAEDAADILDDAGAFDVDERAAQYGNSGTGSTSDYGSTGSTSSSVLGTDTTLNTPGLSGAGAALGSATGSFSADNSINATNTGSTYGSSTTDNLAGTTGLNTSSEGTQKISIIEENLQVGKREVLTGGKRLRSRIVERPVEESLRLREENVTVNRTPVDRPATSADLANFQGTEIEMTETKEVPVVSKEARVVEEVSLGKEVEQRNETVSDTVRKTEVDVEDIEKNNDLSTKGNSDYNNTSDKSVF